MRISFVVAVLAMMFFVLPGPQLFPIPRMLLGFFGAGFLATLWYERRTGQRLSIRSGARIGWITGIFSFAIVVAMGTLTMLAISAEGGFENIRKQLPAQDPNFDEAIKMLGDPSRALLVMVFGLVFLFVLVTTLPMLGGAVRAKLSEKRV